MSLECASCKDFLTKNKSKFGITGNVPDPTCLDICVQNVRCISTKQINEVIALPSINHILNNCRGIVDYPGEIDTTFASFRVTSAREELVHCNTERPGVRIIVHGQIVVRTSSHRHGCPSYIAIPVKVVDEVIHTFYSTKDGSVVHCLKDELAYIDGSCLVVNLNCTIFKDTSTNCHRYMARIQGNVTDKLWKRENIWVTGIKPYPESSLTFIDDFEVPCCNSSSISNEENDNHSHYLETKE